MKIVIFGATGTIGRLAVKWMIEDGHHITAFARHPEKRALCDANLTLRPSAFTDSPARGALKEAVRPGDRALKLKIRRDEVADFLRRQLHDARYLHRAVGISY